MTGVVDFAVDAGIATALDLTRGWRVVLLGFVTLIWAAMLPKEADFCNLVRFLTVLRFRLRDVLRAGEIDGLAYGESYPELS